MSLDITGFVIEGDPEITEHLLHLLGDRWLDSIGSAATTTYCTAPSPKGALPSLRHLHCPRHRTEGASAWVIPTHQVASDNGRLMLLPTPETGSLSRSELGPGDDVLPYIQTTGSAVTVSGHAWQVKAPREWPEPSTSQ